MIQTATTRRWRPEIVITILLLLIPLGIASYCMMPTDKQFTALGETVSIREIGVGGSVHFVYVREGITHNRYEEWSVHLSLPDAVFKPADASTRAAFAEMQQIGTQAKNETILNALTSAEEQSPENEPSSPAESSATFQDKLDQLQEETASYYGDSLGLMLGIGLVEEKEQIDFSKGGRYNIAGTGTLEADHTVGSVGAIRDKLRTAEQFGTDYFFVPKDRETFSLYYDGISNEEEAAQTVQDLHLKLRVIPVSTLEEALQFLRKLHT